MKPSEQFADLRRAAEAMDDCQDKADLLALFRTADGLFETVRIIHKLRSQDKRLKKNLQWLWKWRPMFKYFEHTMEKEKIVPLRKGDADIQSKSAHGDQFRR